MPTEKQIDAAAAAASDNMDRLMQVSKNPSVCADF
jgi:hypothetical protein